MEDSTSKFDKFRSMVSQTDIIKLFAIRGELEALFNALTESEIDHLVEMNALLVQSCAPSSRTTIKNINVSGNMVLINIDHSYALRLSKEEVVGVLLHEIGHVLNPNKKDMEGEFAADKFANDKGYGYWIIEGIKKGIKNKWIGFEEGPCLQRITKLNELGPTKMKQDDDEEYDDDENEKIEL